MKIRCVVERITYQNPENGYTILKTRVKDYAELVPVVGNLFDVSVGSVLLIDGSWKVDPKYGKQFMAEHWEEVMPASIYGIEKYLGSGLIKGVGPKYAKKIVQTFGVETLDVIENNPERLSEVEGIGEKRVRLILDSWQKQREIKNVMMFLQEYEVSTSYASRIYAAYGNETIAKIKENPYRLADDIWGIGFKTADMFAQKMGYALDSYARCRSGILYTLSTLGNEGHVYAERNMLIEKSSEILGIEESFIVFSIDHMLKEGDIIQEKKVRPKDLPLEEKFEGVYLPPFFFAEIGVTGRLKKIAATPGSPVCVPELVGIENSTGIQYDEIQMQAIRTALTSKVFVLTGGPGTGKTTTTQGILQALRTSGLKVILAAPTGRAAKRMSEATGQEARTIHRMLEYNPSEGYQRNSENPLEGDVLIVDESSMVDVLLMNAMLKAVPDRMRLILVGDIDQLPSVGPGNVLRDIIASGSFPVVSLTRVFRQAQNSDIIMNAHRINHGSNPILKNRHDGDFFFLNEEEPTHAAQTIVQLVNQRLPSYYHLTPSAIQVLTPMQRGEIGASNLNLLLQKALNPQSPGLYRGGIQYRLKDRVMQIKNNYDKEVFNGDIGIISNVDTAGNELSVDFDGRKVDYDISELDELVLAYATTIHKAQGSEYSVVVMPIMMTHFVMLQRNLLYTGITRAKKLLVLVGTPQAIALCVQNTKVARRNTLLAERLQENPDWV